MFVEYESPKVGDKVITKIIHSNFAGYFEVGSKVKVVDITDRGYSISNGKHTIREIGWEI